MKKLFPAVLIQIFLITLFANDLEQKITDGTVNWSSKTIYITGGGVAEINGSDLISARLGAERSAVNNSIERGIEAFLSIGVNGKKSIRDLVKDQKGIKSAVERHIRKSKHISSRYYSDGSVELVFALPMDTILNEVVINMKDTPSQESKMTVSRISFEPDENERKEVLVINMRKHNFIPVLFPVVAGAGSEIIYDRESTELDKYGKGAVFYVSKNAEEMLKAMGLKGKELVVNATGISKDNSIIVGKEGSDKIKKELSPDALRKGNVILLFP